MNAIGVLSDCDDGAAFVAAPHLGKPGDALQVAEGIVIGRLPGGTLAGKSAVIVFVPLPDGRCAAAQMTMANFLAVAELFRQADRRDEEAGVQRERGFAG
jgi:hypothetical protein